jgi:ABC-type transport system involved in cytochrome bd biosynthesis fused ATPase/permease subunit
MIKTRLIKMLSHARKYIIFQVFWQWVALIAQIVLMYSITHLLWGVLCSVTYGDAFVYRRYLIMIAVAGLARFIANRRAARASFEASVDVKRILRDKIYAKLLRLGASYREQVPTSEIVQLAGEGVEQLETYFGKFLSQFFYSLIAPLTLFVVLFRVSLKASLVLLVCVPLIPGVIMMVQKIAKRLLSKYWDIYAGLGDSFLENLQGMTTLKIYRADAKKAKQMDAESERFRVITMKVLQMQLNSIIIMDVIAYGGAALGMIITISGYLNGEIDFPGALWIILLAVEFFLPMRLLGSYFHIAMNGMAASDKIFHLLDLPEPEEKTVEIGEGRYDICIRDLSFAYAAREEGIESEAPRDVLRNISMDFPVGSFTSLVGLSGCGKSTVAGILMGRNRGYRGSVTIGGSELSEINEKSLMDTITLVSNNSHLFKGTVRENLSLGNPHATDEQMTEILKLVNLDKEKDLDTEISENGSNLSGGQRQRLALARALLHNTPVYIFDEATSNIDMESEELIMRVIRQLAKSRTVILISHRLANVVSSDRIYMLEEGRVIESGTHRELMTVGGSYRKLYRRQRALESYSRGQKDTAAGRRRKPAVKTERRPKHEENK